MHRDDVAELVRLWNGKFWLKASCRWPISSGGPEIGCAGIVLSNHGSRQVSALGEHARYSSG